MNLNKFLKELKRRHVLKSIVAYLVFAWLLLQVFSILFPILNAPEWALKVLTLVLALGLPIWIIISWIYDITPNSIEKTTNDSGSELVRQATNKRLNAFIIAGLSIAVIVLSLNLFFFKSSVKKDFSLAVIPFNNIRVDEDKEWLSQNFSQNVNTYLSKVKELKVIDSYSSGKFINTEKTNIEIGEELEVAYVLRGTLTQLNQQINVTVELIDVITNSVEWSEHYEGILEDDALLLSQEISKKIVSQLRVQLTKVDQINLDQVLSENTEANVYYNEAVRVADNRGPSNFDSILPRSAKLFQKAIDIDPNYADAYSEMALVVRLMADDNDIFKNHDKFTLIDSLLNKSLKLDHNNVRAFTVLGMEASSNNDWVNGKTYLEKAISLNPNDATANHYFGLYYRNKIDPDLNKALEYMRKAHRMNPFSLPIQANIITLLLDLRNIEEAEAFYIKSSLYPHPGLASDIEEAKIKKEVTEKKDWSVAIDYYHRAIETDSTNSAYYRKLANAYNEIMNDSKSYLEYAKKAWDIGRVHSQNADFAYVSSNGMTYYYALLRNDQFDEAETLLRDSYFKSFCIEPMLYYLEFFLHHYKQDYITAEEVLEKEPYEHDFELLINYAQREQLKKIDSIFERIGNWPVHKAAVFAILKERDSMYYYLNDENIDFKRVNGSVEFDPYRIEDRFKTWQKKHYLPVMQ